MDDLLALFDEHPPEDNTASPKPPSPRNEERNKSERRTNTGKETESDSAEIQPGTVNSGSPARQQRKKARLSQNVDERVGFRISKRLVSSLDLLEMLSTHPYHSPAALSAMSLKQLNALLTDPAQVLDKATVCGKTQLLTVGLVFSNTGTRLSSASGKAFTIVTMGTLRTGPCVSLLLFGSAYGKFCKRLLPGQAVAILCPRVVPPKEGYAGDTCLSFSLNDERQIVVLGTAEDFALCQAKIRGKNESGHWVAEARRCRNFVDTTVCLYCQSHRKLANVKSSVRGSSSATVSSSTRMDGLRQEAGFSAHSTSHVKNLRDGRILTLPTQAQILPFSSRFSQAPAVARRGGATHPVSLPQSNTSGLRPLTRQGPRTMATSSLSANRGASALSNSILNPRQHPVCSRPATTVPSAGRSIASTLSTKPSMTNPYARPTLQTKSAERLPANPIVTPAANRRPVGSEQGTKVNLGDLLLSSKRSKNSGNGSSVKKARTTLNMDVAGFNGSVLVPKPKGRLAATSISQSHGARVQPQQHAKDTATIRERQRDLAAKMQNTTPRATSSGRKAASSSSNEGWCVPLDDGERERLLNIKSAFATEADAENFAASRRTVVELEKEEERRMKTKKQKNDAAEEDRMIRKTWRCNTCHNSFSKRPNRCFHQGHDVAVARDLRQTASKDKTRTTLSNKASEDGGLKLGSGLDWSWSRFS
jgi:rubrerythrin